MSSLMLCLYLAALILLGWGLSLPHWPAEHKWLSAGIAVIILPIWFLIPTIFNRDSLFSSLHVALGITTLLWGVCALASGWGGAILLRRWRGRRG